MRSEMERLMDSERNGYGEGVVTLDVSLRLQDGVRIGGHSPVSVELAGDLGTPARVAAFALRALADQIDREGIGRVERP